MSWDFCDIIQRLRSHYFPKDRDVYLQTNRYFYLGDGTQIAASCFVPVGGIILWSGAIVDIPTNWQLCNGTNGTPDLRDRFVVGAGSTYAVDDTGGQSSIDIEHNHGGATGAGTQHRHGYGNLSTDSDSHTHGPGTLSTGSPSAYQNADIAVGVVAFTQDHTHDVDSGVTASDSHSHDLNAGNTGYESSHTHSISNALSTTQSVLNPYYALAYIMRLA